MFLVSSCSCLCAIHWSHVLSRQWRCSWSSADIRCFNYIWVTNNFVHDDVIKWKHFPRYWPFVREIHRSPVNFPHKGQWCGALMFTLICARMNGWVNNREAGDLRRYLVHYDVIVMWLLRCDILELDGSFCFIRVNHSHIHQGCFTGTEAIECLPQFQWSNPEGYG